MLFIMEKPKGRSIKEYNFRDSLYIISNKPHKFFKKGYNFPSAPLTRTGYQKFAMFDMDSTIIRTLSGKTYAQDENDWTFLFDNVPDTLKSFRENGYEVLLITNQKQFTKNTVYRRQIISKVHKLIRKIGISLDFVILSNDDEFRKPSPCALYFLVGEMFPALHFDFVNSFYCGDAAGRLKTKFRKKDFANRLPVCSNPK